ncbi:hypothetical protein N2152v2_010396 [Parachlorella kessleri]
MHTALVTNGGAQNSLLCPEGVLVSSNEARKPPPPFPTRLRSIRGGGGRAVDFSSYGDGAGNVDTGTRSQSGTGGMRPGSDLAEAGLADISAAAPGHSTAATEEQTGQGISEAMDAGAYLGSARGPLADRSAEEAHAWRGRRQHDPNMEGFERPPAHGTR